MIIVTLATLAGWAATVAAFVGLLRSEQRSHGRREDLLINQLLHAAGVAWQPPPAAEKPARVEPPEQTWTAAPEQDPIP